MQEPACAVIAAVEAGELSRGDMKVTGDCAGAIPTSSKLAVRRDATPVVARTRSTRVPAGSLAHGRSRRFGRASRGALDLATARGVPARRCVVGRGHRPRP